VIFDGFASSPVDTDWTVTSGTLLLSSTRAPDLNDSVTVSAGALVQLGQANQILTTGSIGGTFDLAGFDETLQTLTGGGIVTNANSGAVSTLTLTTTGTLAATLTNAAPAGLSLVLNGTTGGQIFTIGNAANSYGGGTTLNAGVLSLAGNDVLGAGGLAVVGSATTVQVRSSSADARVYAGSLSLRDAVVLGDATSAGELTFSGATTLAAATTITGSSTVTLSGAIGDSGAGYGLTKTGAALLVLSGTNTYSGVTTLAAGTLRAAGTNTSNGSTLVQSGSLQLGADNPLAGGALQLDGGTVSSDSTTARRLDNAITLSGSIVLGNASNTGGLNLAGGMTISGTGRQLNVASPVEISGAIGDGGQSLGFTKLGTGVLTLSGTNTYSGTTAITAGTLLARGVNTSGGATSLATAVLQLGRDNPLASGTLTFTSGTLSSDGTTARSLSTPTVLNGNVTMGDATNTGGLTFTGAFALNSARTLTTASDVVVNSGITSDNSNRILTKQGAGTLTINAASTHGGTTLTAGRLRVGAANALGTTQTVTLSGGALSSTGTTARTLGNAMAINGNATIGDVTDSGVMTFTGAAAVSNNPTLTIASEVVMSRFTGTGQTFTKAGNSRLTLTGVSTMTGTTVLTAGTLFMQSGASLAATSSLIVNNGATLAGTGTTGAVWINDGGTISPGNSPGTSFAGDVTLEAGGNYNWQLYNALGTAGTGWDLISLSSIGLLDLTGLSESSRFNINTWTLSGTGPDVNGAPLNFVYETGTSYRFSVIAVNEVSSILLPASLGTPVADMDITSLFTLNTASVNGTGGWQSPTPASWNMSVRIGTDGKSIDIIVVPEPGTLVLVGIGAACAAWAARRRRA
jgi:autotransporter-associated beta strand protein